MTIQMTSQGRWPRTDPDCPGDRHAPTHQSFTHGCRCPDTMLAEDGYQAARPSRPPQGRRGELPSVHDNPRCTSGQHRPTQAGWNNGCRCSGAMAAHQRWLEIRKARRAATRARAALGIQGCVADKHDSVNAYSWGCRCPGTVERYREALRRKAEADYRDPRYRWRGGKMAVDRNNLWMLLHGVVDSPTVAERMAAMIALEGTHITESPWTSRPINDAEIGERLGYRGSASVTRLRERRARLREQRTKRRLADVVGKARDVRRAAGRKQREAAVHEAARARKAAWKQHCRTMRRLRESQERDKRVTAAIERRARFADRAGGGAVIG